MLVQLAINVLLVPTATKAPGRAEEIVLAPKVQVSGRVPLYRRLHGCIQAAASKVKDFTAKRCTKRVEILVNLIPKDCGEDLGMYVYAL